MKHMDHLENNTTQLPINACKIDNLYCVQNVLSSIKVEPKTPLTPIPVNIPIPSPPDFTKLEIKGMKEENTNSEVKSNTRLLTPLLVSTASIERIRLGARVGACHLYQTWKTQRSIKDELACVT